MTASSTAEKYPITIDGDGVWWLKGRIHEVWIERRPAYCDRGHFVANVQPVSGVGIEYSIDSYDAWPRYYMDIDRAFAEIREWLEWREGDGPALMGHLVFG